MKLKTTQDSPQFFTSCRDGSRKSKALILSLILALFATPFALAQEEEVEEEVTELEEFVVTGSRMSLTEDATASSVSLLTEIDFDASGITDTFEFLQTLTEVSGSGNFRGSTGTVSGSSESFVALRGLASNSTLVLVNGRRMPFSAGPQVDPDSVNINGIPFSAIKRIEVLKEGASPIYGSDAIAGVINIILHDSYRGAEFTLEYGNSTASDDAGTVTVSGIAGFGDEKTDALITLFYRKQNGMLAGNRPETADADATAFGGGNGRSSTGPRGRFNHPTLGSFIVIGTNTDFFVGGPNGATVADDPSDFKSFSFDEDSFNFNDFADELKPLESFGISASVTHKLVEDRVEFFAEGMFSRDVSDSVLAPTPIFGEFEPILLPDGTTSLLVIAADNPINPYGVDGTFRRRVLELGNRVQEITHDVLRVVAGVRGQLGGISYESAFLFAFDESTMISSGTINKSELFNQIQNTNPDITTWNPFGSPDYNLATEERLAALRRVGATVTDRGDFELVSWDFNANANVFEMPAGDLKIAVGLEYREEVWNFVPDSLKAAFNTIGSTNQEAGGGGRDVFSIYGEAAIPLISPDMEAGLAYKLDLTLAIRSEDYSDFGSTTNPRIGVRYEPIEGLMFRGSYSEGFRAPGLPDLHQGLIESFDFIFSVADRPDPGQIQARRVTGGNPTLKAEESESYNLGMVWTPDFFKNLTFRFDYFDISQINIVDTLPSEFVLSAFLAGDELPPGNTVTLSPIPLPDGSVELIEKAPANLGSRDVDGFDYGITYTWDLENMGRLTFNFTGTHILTYEETLLPGGEIFESAGDSNDLINQTFPRNIWNFFVTWNKGDLTVVGTWSHIDGVLEDDFINDGFRNTGNWNSFDIQASYRLPWEDSTITFGIENFTDETPGLLLDGQSDFYDRDHFTNMGAYYYLRLRKKF